jgi:SPP1 gp7 family putative phage head morphogenesis protein
MRILEESLLDTGYDYVKNLERQYATAIQDIESQIAKWYQRFATENGITLAEANKLLTTQELDEFRWTVEEYIKYGQENAVSQAWYKQLKNASARVHVSRLESLKLQLQAQAEALHGAQTELLETSLVEVYERGYYHTAFELQKGIGVGWTLHGLTDDTIKKVLARPWTLDAQTFSDRIWANKQALVNSVNTQLTQTIMRGAAPDKAIKAIADRFKVSRSQAGRLVMTETAAFANMARKDCFTDLGVKKYVIVETLDKETCSLCGSLDGKVYPMSAYKVGVTAPPFHPWCRGTTAPYYEDMENLGDRFARDDEGKRYTVPKDMTYKEWFKRSVVPTKNDKSPFTSKENSDNIIKEPEIGYTDYEKAEKVLSKDATPWVQSLTEDQHGAIDAYTGDIYTELNAWLRSGMEYEDDWLESLTADIDSALAGFTLSQDISVLRGTSTEVLKELGVAIDKAVGKTLWDPAYLSSTIAKSVAGEFADMAVYNSGGQRVFLQFDIPAGEGRGAFVDSISANSGELEFLIRRDAQFEVYAVDKLDGDTLIKARWKE